MSIKQLPAAARPRERLLALGPSALTDAELLALLLRTGTAGKGVLTLADEVLQQFDGLHGLLHAEAGDLRRIKGLGPAKRAEVAAVVEIARRALRQQLQRGPVFDAPQKVKDYAALHLAALPHEMFAAMYLDAQHRLIEMQPLFRGTLTQTSVYPREVLRAALALNAAAVILAHNHPSGIAEPSRADELLTQTLKNALQLIDVRVLDHVIVGAGQVISLAERGLM